MRRSFTLSTTGLGLFLIALGVACFSDLTFQTGYLGTVFRFYPVLPILLGLDYLLNAFPSSADRIERPAGWVSTLIILVTIGGLLFNSLPRFIQPSFENFREFHFWPTEWWADRETARTIEKGFPLPSGVTTVQIENDFGNISVDSADTKTIAATAEIKIRGFQSRRMNRYESEIDLVGAMQGDRYLIRLQKPEALINRHFPAVAANIGLRIPKGLSVEIVSGAGNIKVGDVDGNLTINESAGKIEVDRVGKNLVAHNSLGAIQIGTVLGDANIRASAGRIEVTQINGSADIESSLGEVHLQNCAGPTRAKVDKGQLKVNLSQVVSDCNFEVSMGSAEIGIARLAKFSLDANTSMGSINSEFPIAVNKEMTEAKASGAVNGGGPLVRVHTSMGSIQLQGI